MRAVERRWLLALAAVLAPLAACGPASSGATPASPTLTLTFTPKAFASTDVTLTTATMTLTDVHALGDTPPSSPPPSMTKPMHMDNVVALNALGGAVAITIDLPPGLYSRVDFDVTDVSLAGTLTATGEPFTATLAMFQGPHVDLRPSSPVEVQAAGVDASVPTIAIAVDPSTWFAPPSPLDGATPSADGGVTCDDQQNAPAADALTMRLKPSFSVQ
ncbi:MAG TPA: hypothetical protein VH560_00045 [Polyangia bacterium]|jgi:hypothetical protein|nr:hypothetical protein [Polyangia bacterium]